MQNLAWPRGWISRAAIAVSLALGSGLGSYAIAHAATSPAPDTSPTPSTNASPSTGASPSTSPGAGTHVNCPNM